MIRYHAQTGVKKTELIEIEMGKRLRVAITYSYSENWIGGTYYIQNLVFALNNVSDEKKPLIVITTYDKADFDSLVELTKYPYLEFYNLNVKHSLILRATNKIGRILFKRNIIRPYLDFDLCFQNQPFFQADTKDKTLFWIPDFQEHYFPEFFEQADINFRKSFQALVAAKGKYVVFSSQNAQADFNKFFAKNKTKQFVLNFAVTHSPVKETNLGNTLQKFGLTEVYFICCNQFWAHKNHVVVLNAVYELKQRGISITVAFSGKEFDYRSPDYFNSIKSKCNELAITDNIKFLGFIDRADQLQLMQNAKAVIQPSLFEGWSTVVEDAKALNANIIVSNIGVHQEQLHNYPQKIFFDPHDPQQLADCMIAKFVKEPYSYEQAIINYGNKFIEIANAVVNTVTISN